VAKGKYNHPEIADLAKQMTYLAKEVRKAQLHRAATWGRTSPGGPFGRT